MKPKYRMLKTGDIIEFGDQYKYRDGKWKTVKSLITCVLGNEYLFEYRRKVTPKKKGARR